MKLINEKGKLFGIINIVDLLAALLIIFVVGAVAWKVFGDRIAAETELRNKQAQIDKLAAQRIEVTYTVRCSTMRSAYYDELVDFGFPQQLAINDGPIDGAYIVDAYAEPTTAVFGDNEGEGVLTNYGDRVDIVVTIKANVPPSAFVTIGSQEIRVGKSHIVKTQFWEISGIIETLDCDPQPFVDAGQSSLVIPELMD